MRIFRYMAVAALLAASALFLAAQRMQPETPVRNFSLPVFGDNGYKAWEIEGLEGRYISPELIEVRGMRMRKYSGDSRVAQEALIESPTASVYPKRNAASGKDLLTITGQTYSVRGREWTWDGRTHRITINRDAEVIFRESLIDILQ